MEGAEPAEMCSNAVSVCVCPVYAPFGRVDVSNNTAMPFVCPLAANSHEFVFAIHDDVIGDDARHRIPELENLLTQYSYIKLVAFFLKRP